MLLFPCRRGMCSASCTCLLISALFCLQPKIATELLQAFLCCYQKRCYQNMLYVCWSCTELSVLLESETWHSCINSCCAAGSIVVCLKRSLWRRAWGVRSNFLYRSAHQRCRAIQVHMGTGRYYGRIRNDVVGIVWYKSRHALNTMWKHMTRYLTSSWEVGWCSIAS